MQCVNSAWQQVLSKNLCWKTNESCCIAPRPRCLTLVKQLFCEIPDISHMPSVPRPWTPLPVMPLLSMFTFSQMFFLFSTCLDLPLLQAQRKCSFFSEDLRSRVELSTLSSCAQCAICSSIYYLPTWVTVIYIHGWSLFLGGKSLQEIPVFPKCLFWCFGARYLWSDGRSELCGYLSLYPWHWLRFRDRFKF